MVVVWGDAAARQQDPKCKHPGRQGPGHSTAKDVASMTHTTSEVLNLAADLIEEHGWIQGAWGLGWNGAPILPLCAEGAILAAAGLGERWLDARRQYGSYGGEKVLDSCPATSAVKSYIDYNDIANWNDDEWRTATEVIEVLRATAVIEAARESAAVRESVSA